MTTAWALPRELSIYTASELRADWLTRLAAEAADGACDDDCRIDAGAVERSTPPACSCLRRSRAPLFQRERTISLQQPSRALVEACEALGADALLVTAPEAST